MGNPGVAVAAPRPCKFHAPIAETEAWVRAGILSGDRLPNALAGQTASRRHEPIELPGHGGQTSQPAVPSS